MEERICTKCNISRPIEEFHMANAKKLRRRRACKFCCAKYIRKYTEEQGEGLRRKWKIASKKYYDYDRRRNKTLSKYGLTNEDYNELYDEQEGKCKICNSNLTLCVDHCHTTNKIRGLLCNSCNIGLGCFKDNIDTLKIAITYLENCGKI